LIWLYTAAEGDDTAISILERGEHRLPFDFALPEQCLPCSFESRVGTVRYYLRVIIDIPYASPPQGLKYFTVIGPHIDCNDDKYSVSLLRLYSDICMGGGGERGRGSGSYTVGILAGT